MYDDFFSMQHYGSIFDVRSKFSSPLLLRMKNLIFSRYEIHYFIFQAIIFCVPYIDQLGNFFLFSSLNFTKFVLKHTKWLDNVQMISRRDKR